MQCSKCRALCKIPWESRRSLVRVLGPADGTGSRDFGRSSRAKGVGLHFSASRGRELFGQIESFDEEQFPRSCDRYTSPVGIKPDPDQRRDHYLHLRLHFSTTPSRPCPHNPTTAIMSRKSLAVASLLLIAFAAMAQGKVTISVTGYLGDYTPFSYSGALDLAVNPQTGQIVSKESNLVGFVLSRTFLEPHREPGFLAGSRLRLRPRPERLPQLALEWYGFPGGGAKVHSAHHDRQGWDLDQLSSR